MPRGLVWRTYVADDGVSTYSKLADADEAADPTRGWAPLGVPPAQVFPRQSRPRLVYGVSPTTGRRGHTVVASTAAPLWTGAATSFVVRSSGSGEDTDTLNVTRRRGESFAIPH